MLIKEYHILLPMSLDEYQVAQLYMIQKKSREESSGEGSGVEILANRPYSDGPGGSGQYTHKIYHVGSHIPSWFRALLPKAALQVEEESWNAYPYTRTRYTCPFVEKFSIEIETYYRPDAGQQTNIFNLGAAEKRQRILDTIDIVRDPISPNEYKAEEDPKLYRSVKTGRGPLGEDWLEVTAKGALMCAYKLCKVEFRYWGMQSKIEQFIHDVGLRKVMLRAHRQAWCWQDEWTDLTMEDIRQLEEETARMLAQKMAKCNETEEAPSATPTTVGHVELGGTNGQEGTEAQGVSDTSPDDTFAKQWSLSSRSSHSSQHGGGVSPQSLSEWRMQNIARDSENSSEEEFFDAHEDLSDSDEVFAKEMTKWNSNDFLDTLERPGDLDEGLGDGAAVAKLDGERLTGASFSEGGLAECAAQACCIHALFLILHSGNILDQGTGEPGSKKADVQTLAATFDAVTRVHFPEALGHVALRLVPCPSICAAAYALVSNLSPYSHDGDSLSSSQDHIPLAALPLLATSSGGYQYAVATVIARANQAYNAFLRSAEGNGFCGQVVLIGDCVGGILGFDALCQSRAGTTGSRGSSRRGSLSTEPISPELHSGKDPLVEGADGVGGPSRGSPEPGALLPPRECRDVDSVRQQHNFLCSLQASVPPVEGEAQRGSVCVVLDGAESASARLDFKVSGFFLFGSPLGLVLALRKTVMPAMDVAQLRPACDQIYNLFHAADPCASRLEPLLAKAFHAMPPLSVPRYQKYPLGDGTSALLAEALQMHSALFLDDAEVTVPVTPTSGFAGFWRGSEVGEMPTPTSTSEVVKILERWWGVKRIDYLLYCPDALTAFPTITLPHLFHASYWESSDVVAFILRQVIEKERPQMAECEESSIYSPAIPREKWQRKRTQVKIRNVTANHRASDVVVCEGRPQVLSGRFMYGPLDVVTLTGEKVDIYIMTQPLSGKWLYYGTEVTSGSGRLAFTIPPDKALAIGMYPVRMVVRGDHSYAEAYLTVVARGTEAVVFSIDGSFTASVSIMGSDPKVRAGAVDVVRHWQDSGYMIVYVTGRPDMQKHRVVAWLSQHNFPHGVVSFCDGLTHDPLRQKAAFLQSLRTEAEITIMAGYGSAKDISVYSSLGLLPSQIYIVGRAVKKLQSQCQFLSEGYVAHLAQLEAALLAHSPKGPPRPTLGKGTYGCPAPVDFLRKQSQLLRSRGPSQAECEGGTPPPPHAKARSISLKMESEE
ncbi:membrane-associated phosphatidylinositol transfer protein 1 [Alligator sinensis]|uniref:Membrane-associated Phosphatidylinositol transfer protein 1 n=1 Tax=Alligator sinensis TaxID=38654 RepID=A0A1U7SDV8_ALLSI|nr:membrane-associated phosphatidylinositol transfer protein 1 [Alligator sinensis]XP_025047874.1 membrane-associated phosphatidylinositol transfer protein 1 [Alligator sinensis]